MNEMTYEEFCKQPVIYTFGLSGDEGASRLYRNEKLGIQKETHTKRSTFGDIYGGWEEATEAYFLDGDPREFANLAEVYVAWMERVCGISVEVEDD